MSDRKQKSGRTVARVESSPEAWPPPWEGGKKNRHEVVKVGSVRQLFLDDYVVDETHNLSRRLHHPVRHAANPLISADTPWEILRVGVNAGAYLFGATVLFDEEDRRFKMWYRGDQVIPAPPGSKTGLRYEVPPQGGYSALYATSTDGVQWLKPNLGLTEYEGSKANNLLPVDAEGAGYLRRPMIIKDYHERDPGQRYKMLFLDNPDHSGQWGWVIKKAYSADGIHWNFSSGKAVRFDKKLCNLRGNGELFGWDANLERYVFFTLSSRQNMVPADVDGRAVRHEDSIVHLTSRDFENWRQPVELIASDPSRDSPVWSPGHVGGMTAARYTEDLYIGFLDTVATHAVEDVPAEFWDVYETEHSEHRTELVTSRDGIHWTRVAPHWWFLPPGLPGTWDSDHLSITKPIVLNDEIYIYYTGNNLPCKAQLPGHRQFHLVGKVIDGMRMGYAIGLAKMRLDGFASLEGYDAGGWLLTRPLIFDGDRLVINARAPEKPFTSEWTHAAAPRPSKGPFGTVRVEMTDGRGTALRGYAAKDCDPFTGDEIKKVVTWKGKSDVSPLSGKTVRLRFHLHNAALYSFQFRADQLPAPSFNAASPGSRGGPNAPSAINR